MPQDNLVLEQERGLIGTGVEEELKLWHGQGKNTAVCSKHSLDRSQPARYCGRDHARQNNATPVTSHGREALALQCSDQDLRRMHNAACMTR